MARQQYTQGRLPHPAVSMLGRATARRAQAGLLPIDSATPLWKLHYFARGTYHWQVGGRDLLLQPRTWLVTPPSVAGEL